MTSYILRRAIQFLPVWLGVATIVFFMIHMIPGDPVDVMAGGRPISAEAAQQLREQLGLNRPVVEQYWKFIRNALQGDLGTSYISRAPIVLEIRDRFPYTFQLALAGLGIGIPVGITFGIISALHRGSLIDKTLLVGSLVFISVPGFWFGLLLIYTFSVWLGWLPVGGTEGVASLLMPAFVLSLGSAATLTRLTRASMLEVLRADFIRTARSKGLSERVVQFKHALRNALNPVVTIVGIIFGRMLGGAFIIEQVFARPGLGRLAVTSIFKRDFPMVQGIVLYTATLFLVANLLVDLSYAILDPRIRYQ